MKKISEQLEEFIKDDQALQKHISKCKRLFREKEPTIKSFVPEDERFGRLSSEIIHMRKQYPKIEDRPPFYGLLIGVKDIFHVDGFPTQAGTKLPADVLTGEEGTAIKKLKRNGAIILGKTVTTEFAYFAPGPTRNPHNPDHTPGGSSSGSAAAVAAGLTSLTLGSQTIGSIIRPATYCGVVGFKPSYGRIPTDGVIPLAPSVDTVGFFTERIINAYFISKYLLNGWDESKGKERKPVLGIPVGLYLDEAHPEMKTHFFDVCKQLETHGYALQEIPIMDNFGEIVKHHNNLVAYEAAMVHEAWYKKYHDRYHPKTVALILKGCSVTTSEYKQALRSCLKFRNLLTSTQEQEGIDLWISPPAQGPAPKGIISTGDPIMNLPWTHSGFPTINLPTGYCKNGLPLGLQLSAKFNHDEALLGWAEMIGSDLAKTTAE